MGGFLIRLVILADLRLLSESVEQAVQRNGRLMMSASVSTLPAAFGAISSQRPEIVLIDHGMSDALNAIKAIRIAYPDIKVIALGVPEIDDAILACAEAGAAGYVTRGGGLSELVSIIHSVDRGELICSPRAAAALRERVTVLASEHTMESRRPLTKRERDILALLERGFSNKDIAAAVRIAVATVKNHVHMILEKLRVTRRGEAAALVRSSWRSRVNHKRGRLGRI